MAGSSIGNIFKVTIWGDSAKNGTGIIIDGCPAGVKLSETMIQKFLNRRKPSGKSNASSRFENYLTSFHSGVHNGKTTGGPISITVSVSGLAVDSLNISTLYRPGTADYAYDCKYGNFGAPGAEESELIAKIAAGAVASAVLESVGINICAYVQSIGPVPISYINSTLEALDKSSLNMPDLEATEAAENYLAKLKDAGDTTGGVVECIISGVPAGVGNSGFEKLDARLAQAVMSIDLAKGFEIGSGIESAAITGSENNDALYKDSDGNISKKTNNAGGILGGVTDGSEIVLRAAFMPSPALAKEQQTVDINGRPALLAASKSPDTCAVPGSCVAVEAMAAITIADMLLENMSAKLENLLSFYKK